MSLFGRVKTAFVSKQPGLQIRPLRNKDLSQVLIIEGRVYDFPWSEQIFRDCLAMNYSSLGLLYDGELIGYAIVSIAVGEAHVLNICVNPNQQGRGFGGQFMRQLFKVAVAKKAERMFLEVRPSNKRAVLLYEKLGFVKIGQRKNYYPAGDGREDALVYSIDLGSKII